MMKIFALTSILLYLAAPGWTQGTIRLTNLSSKYDLASTQTNCKVDWRGKTCDEMIEIFPKNARKPIQSISIRSGDAEPIFGDFNFDGLEDLALSDGKNGGYVTDSYRVYLYSAAQSRFVFNSAFTALSQGPAMGFFEIDKRKKTLSTATRMGFGHFTQRKYDVYRGKPRLVYESTYDESSAEGAWAEITTRKLIGGKWRTWRKREKVADVPTN